MKKVFSRKKSSAKIKNDSFLSTTSSNGFSSSNANTPTQSNFSSLLHGAGGSNKHNHQSSSTNANQLEVSGGGRRSIDSSTTMASRVHVDDFGRPIVDNRPAFGITSLNAYDEDESGTTVDSTGDLQLLFGYAPIETLLELSVERVLEVVVMCSQQIRTRGLDTPLILSSMSLDLTMEGTCSLIRAYLADPNAWAYDLQLASPLCVGAQMKWSLARLVNDRGGRGFVSWELYNDFKQAEKSLGYPAKHCSTHLISRLATASAKLLTEVLSLFSSISAHSKANGMPPRKLASLFSPYIFGLADDETFDVTYEQWQRATDATEHILLAYIRDQQASEGGLPTHLETHILGYPQILNVHFGPKQSKPRVPKGARVEEVMRVRRLTRFHSRNLIASAGTWAVPSSLDWTSFFPRGHRQKAVTPAPSSTNPPPTQFTSQYRHLLNIRGNNLFDEDDDDGELQRYKSTVEKDWSKFGEIGFKDVEASKLEFDLTESERLAPARKRDTMDWGTFETTGFGGRESFKPHDLIFHQSIGTRVNTWPQNQQAIDTKLRAAEKLLPSFPYDTTPREEGRVLVDTLFFEAWADVLVSGGWARDELKESSFALLQWKCRPREGELPKGRLNNSGDDRTEDKWVLVEEFVPKEYRDELTVGKKKANKRLSFMRSVRGKKSPKPPPLPRITHPHHSGSGALSSLSLVSPPLSSSYARSPSPSGGQLRTIDESVFTAEATTPTKVVSLSRADVDAETLNQSNYAPSIVSTTGPGNGHSGMPSVAEEPRDSQSTENDPTRASTGPYTQSEVDHAGRDRSPTPSNGTTMLPPPVPGVEGNTLHGLGVEAVHGNGNGSRSSPAWIQNRHDPQSGQGIGNRGAGLGNIKSSSNGTKNFLSRMTSRNSKKRPDSPGPAASPSGGSGARSMPLTQATLARISPPTQHTAQMGESPAIMVQSPSASNMQRSDSGGIPPPLPPKSNESIRSPTPGAETNRSSEDQHTSESEGRYAVRDSVMSTQTSMSDPYGGLEDETVQVGQVMYRGRGNSQDDSAGEPSPRRVLLSDVMGNSAFTDQQNAPPMRHDSLPPSPKPDAEVPEDVERSSRFLSGASMIPKGKSVSEIIGRIEEGKVGQIGSNKDSVRLTQYGFQ